MVARVKPLARRLSYTSSGESEEEEGRSSEREGFGGEREEDRYAGSSPVGGSFLPYLLIAGAALVLLAVIFAARSLPCFQGQQGEDTM